jgi:hypothetical protein
MWPGPSRALRRVSILEMEHGSRGREPRRAILFLRSSRRVVLKENSSSKTSSQVGMPEFAMILATHRGIVPTHGGTSITTYCERALRVPWPDKPDNAFTGSNRERGQRQGEGSQPSRSAPSPICPSDFTRCGIQRSYAMDVVSVATSVRFFRRRGGELGRETTYHLTDKERSLPITATKSIEPAALTRRAADVQEWRHGLARKVSCLL